MRKDRLEILMKFLEALPAFDINQWSTVSSCGTIHCAGGWACEIPSFKEAGLRLDCNGGPSYVGKSVSNLLNLKPVPLTGYHALASFFEISHFISITLFDPDSYAILRDNDAVTREQVCRRIFTLIASPCP